MGYSKYFQTGAVTIRVESDLAITEETFSATLKRFETDAARGADILVRHHFGLPGTEDIEFTEKVHQQEGLSIFKYSNGWVYTSTGYDDASSTYLKQISFVNPSHTRVDVYHERDALFQNGGLEMLFFYPSDWLVIARYLALHHGSIFHSSGIRMNNHGYLFVGHSGAGKSTMVKMLSDHAQILCDERIIARKHASGFRIHGTWTHGEMPIFSPESAPLKAVFLLRQSNHNRITEIQDKTQAISRLAACVYKPLITADWWDHTLTFVQELVDNVPCHELEFDQSGSVVPLLQGF